MLWTLMLSGAGNVGSGFLEILHDRSAALRTVHGVDLRVVGVCEYDGCVIDPVGLDAGDVLAALRSGRPLSTLPGVGRPNMTARDMLDAADADILLEATPLNLAHGEPGLGTVTAALQRGMHVVTANKGPLALAYSELASLGEPPVGRGSAPPAAGAGPRRPLLRFSATVAGALPVLNIGGRDLAGDSITRIEAVLNGTSQSIVRAMEDGADFTGALLDAQRRGIAEADPSLDVNGWDAACKLLITANAVLGESATLDDIAVEGIRGLDAKRITTAAANGCRLVPLCLAELGADGSYRLSVGPTALPYEHPLARLTPDEMGVAFYTRYVDRVFGASLEPGPGPASAAMLRDVLDIVRSVECREAA
ncbi:hypothetical protein [Streptomyces sp. enrichment culture]|uniref:hypothetical protein n=1 Tax=Streptomyces sp. enrichment culture TaxID=1795815 RepID=UPI003F57384B